MNLKPLTLLGVALIPLACGRPLVESVPATDEVAAPGLSAPVDVVRDEWGVPHIYGERLGDVAFAQGYLMAQDRLVQMDLARRAAAGTLAVLAGALSESVIDRDIRMRLHHLQRNAEDIVAQAHASSDPEDQKVAEALEQFTAGVNLYIAHLKEGRYQIPPHLAFVYDPQTTAPWTEADSVVLGRQIVFNLSFTAGEEVFASELEAAAEAAFDQSADPARLTRRGFGRDLLDLRPIVPVYSQPGGFEALAPLPPAPEPQAAPLALLRAARPSLEGLGVDRAKNPWVGSNNWVIGPSLSASGHAMVANDPHLSLGNPPTFYLSHLVSRDGALDVAGAQFPGAPGVILGHNRHLSWGATTSNLDVTDVYEETIVPCDGSTDPCVLFGGKQVKLQPRVERIEVGRFGRILRTVEVTLWDVPHHGPIIPRIRPDHTLEPLGSKELSVRWTGHEAFPVLRAVLGLDRAGSVREAAATLERHFRAGGQNWVLADDAGHFGWTTAIRMPRRPAGARAWKVLPGDGSAEWGEDLEQRWLPHAFDPPSGYIATANADPIGVTDDGNPWEGDKYIGATFDAGTRVGRIVQLIEAIKAERGKLTIEDLQRIQNDHVSLWNQRLAPVFLEATQALLEELAAPGTHADLQQMVALASPASKALVPMARSLVEAWGYDSPVDSVAATIFNVWVNRFALLAFEDELDVLGMTPTTQMRLKLLVRMVEAPETLSTGLSPSGESILFDDLLTPELETKRQQAAKALFDALDYLIPALGADPSTWTWGRLHTLALEGILPVDAVRLPRKDDPQFPDGGFPRPGGNGTVDVGGHGLDVADYTYASGAVFRAVYEMHPSAPRVKNALPGGQVFDPNSPHYRDLLELWRKNQTYDEPYLEPDVVASARREHEKNGIGRVRFTPR